MKTLYLSIVLTLFATVLFAQPGTLDSDFDADGMVTTDIDTQDNRIFAVAVQPDGKIVAAGYAYVATDYDFVIARYNTDGSLDASFGGNGIRTFNLGPGNDFIQALLLQPDGKIIVAGQREGAGNNADFALACFLPNGDIDLSFGTNGYVYTDFGINDIAYAAALQPDGKIVLAGVTDDDIALARYKPNGTPDSTFSVDGKVTTTIITGESCMVKDIAIQPDGKIVVTGSTNIANYLNIALVRYNSNGTLDTGFDTDGKVNTVVESYSQGVGIALQGDGKILVAAIATTIANVADVALVRYNSDGSPDNSFNAGSTVITHVGTAASTKDIALQPDGKILVAAAIINPSEFLLLRYKANGTADSTFSGNGMAPTSFGGTASAESVALQPDGKIVVGGYKDAVTGFYDFALARFISGLNVGVLELSLAGNMLIYPNPLQADETLEYTLLQDETLDIDLFSISGALVKTFAHHTQQTRGTQRITLDFGTALAGGNYLLKISNGKESMSVQVTKL